MALPTTIDPTAPLGTASPSAGDDQLRAIKQLLVDILGLVTDPTQITAAMFATSAAGLMSVVGSTFTVKQLVSTIGTITSDTPGFTGTATWNSSGTTFNGIKLDVTDTASAAASRLVALLVGGVDKCVVKKDGSVTLAGALNLPSNPTTALQAVTKQYVDALICSVNVFTGDGTWTKPSGLLFARAIAVGGGGGGGGADPPNTLSTAGGGGGSGGYSESFIVAASLGATEVVTVGAGGTAGAAANGTSGGNGGDSSLGTLVIGKGGSGGVGSGTDTVACAAGGAAGVAGTGNIALAGSDGLNGVASMLSTCKLAVGGHGGTSYFGGAGMGGTSIVSNGGAAGPAGMANAGGGGGGGGATGSSTAAGAAGGSGIVIVYDFKIP